MSQLFTAIAVIAGVVLCVVALHMLVEGIKMLGSTEERLRREEERRKLLERQALEIAKDKTLEDIVRDLDAGQF